MKPGDRLICIDNYPHYERLTIGEVYIYVGESESEGELMIIADDMYSSKPINYNKSRFVHEKEYMWNNEIKDIINETGG